MDHGPLALIIDVLHTVKENIIAHTYIGPKFKNLSYVLGIIICQAH